MTIASVALRACYRCCLRGQLSRSIAQVSHKQDLTIPANWFADPVTPHLSHSEDDAISTIFRHYVTIDQSACKSALRGEVPRTFRPRKSQTMSQVAEDTVEYRLYPVECETCDHEYLTRLAVECTHFARCIVGDHLWHYEPFQLAVWLVEEGGQGWVPRS